MKVDASRWCRAVGLLLTLLFFTQAAGAENWKLFGKSESAQIFIDLDSIHREPESTTLWVKYVFTPSARARFREDSKVDPYFSRERIEIKFGQERRSRHLILYRGDGSVLYERSQDNPWVDVLPGDTYDLFWRFLSGPQAFVVQSKFPHHRATIRTRRLRQPETLCKTLSSSSTSKCHLPWWSPFVSPLKRALPQPLRRIGRDTEWALPKPPPIAARNINLPPPLAFLS